MVLKNVKLLLYKMTHQAADTRQKKETTTTTNVLLCLLNRLRHMQTRRYAN